VPKVSTDAYVMKGQNSSTLVQDSVQLDLVKLLLPHPYHMSNSN